MIVKEYIIAYSKQYYYFSIKDLKRYLTSKKIKFSPVNLKSYLYILKKQKLIYQAGRGWYSAMDKVLELNIKPVEKIVNLIKQKFPEIKFSCWSNEQLTEFYHHFPFHFIAFVYTEKELMVYLKELLESKGLNVYKNPLKREAEKFISRKKNTVILRPIIISRGKIGEYYSYYSRIEKILVDLYIERQKLNLMDEEEYGEILKEVLTNYRVDIAEMLDYAHNRKLKENIDKLLQALNIIPMRNYAEMSQK
jgi:hypothetical protein